MSQRKKFSPIWDLFTDCGAHAAKCDVCKQTFSFKTSLSNLKRHIERKHPTVQINRQSPSTSEIHSQPKDVIPGPSHIQADSGGSRQSVDLQQQPEQQQQFTDVTLMEEDPVEADDFGGFAQDVGATYMSSANDQREYCLTWKFHQNNQQTMFSKLLQKESFCDVTIACEEKILRAHKLVLSACSSYFEMILSRYEVQNPIIILKDVRYDDMSALLQFIYKGEVNIEQSQLSSLLETADMLKVKGLSEICGEVRRLEDPLQTLDMNTEEQQDVNPTFEPVKTMQQRRRIISIPEESFHKPLKIPRRSTSIEITQNVPTPVSQSAPSSSPLSSADYSVQIEGVIRLPEFLIGHGSYQDFWKKPWVVKALKAVSDREMTLRNCSDLLGVEYNSLCSRYRQVHGCSKETSVYSSQDYTYRFRRAAAVDNQEGRIILRRDQISAVAAALSLVNQSENERPADTSRREDTAEPIFSVKVEPSSSLSDQFENEMMENNADSHIVGQIC
ncbi:uncharacterized protein [Periplaneta americana]|uniref:uncharacterized protein isoform X2 n=1 Tax=Periplaneta americana TaxID=6978 RepID=UPI0037E7C780